VRRGVMIGFGIGNWNWRRWRQTHRFRYSSSWIMPMLIITNHHRLVRRVDSYRAFLLNSFLSYPYSRTVTYTAAVLKVHLFLVNPTTTTRATLR
jgi:hypothetical protein